MQLERPWLAGRRRAHELPHPILLCTHALHLMEEALSSVRHVLDPRHAQLEDWRGRLPHHPHANPDSNLVELSQAVWAWHGVFCGVHGIVH